MSDKINLLKRVSSLDIAPSFTNYSKVIIHIDDETQVEVGDDTGRTLEYTDPFGSEEQARAQLEALRGYQYQPFYAEGALLDPAAEVGDGVAVSNVYGGVYQRSRNFDRLMKADIAAPHDKEIDHEYQFVSPTERKFKRQMGDVRASLIIQADRIEAEVTQREADSAEFRSQLSIQATEIAAKVSQVGGDSSSFGWSLMADRFSLFAGSREVFKATESGIEVDGKITARSGYIGNEAYGFTITASAIYNNIPEFGGTQSTGVYIGTNGIQLGQNFKVDSAGNLTAASGTFTGSVRAGSIQYGGANGYFNGGGIAGGSIGTGSGSPLSLSALGGIGGGINFNSFENGSRVASSIKASNATFNILWVANYRAVPSRIQVMGPDGRTPIYLNYMQAVQY